MNRQQPPQSRSTSKQASQVPEATIDGARGKLSVREAGRKGGLRVRELINRGRQVEASQGEQRPH